MSDLLNVGCTHRSLYHVMVIARSWGLKPAVWGKMGPYFTRCTNTPCAWYCCILWLILIVLIMATCQKFNNNNRVHIVVVAFGQSFHQCQIAAFGGYARCMAYMPLHGAHDGSFYLHWSLKHTQSSTAPIGHIHWWWCTHTSFHHCQTPAPICLLFAYFVR